MIDEPVSDAGPRTAPLAVKAIRKVDAGESIFGAHFVADSAFFVLGAEALMRVAPGAAERKIPVHAGAILASAAGPDCVVTGGDDGAVVATDAAGERRQVAADAKRRWIDTVAIRDGAIAWSAGRQVFLKDAEGTEHGLELSAAAGGLAIESGAPAVIVAHNNGITRWKPGASSAAVTTALKGSHAGAALSPDGRLLATATHEPFVHLWRLADMAHMRLTGYGEAVKSLAWTADASWLASAGSERVFLWPAPVGEGPMYSVPFLLAPHRARVTVVACHPFDRTVAVGYADGLVLLVRIQDGAEIILNRPGQGAIAALAWSATGEWLAFGSEEGHARVIQFG
jgi:hypothetical protein